jgi:hypothetical protein
VLKLFLRGLAAGPFLLLACTIVFLAVLALVLVLDWIGWGTLVAMAVVAGIGLYIYAVVKGGKS